MTTSGPAAKQTLPGSQTLDRGLRALELLAEAERPLSIAQLAERLEVHRSSAYRILRTLEEHRFVLRDDAGLIRLGPRLSALGRRAAPSLTQIAQPELVTLANRYAMTAFVAVLDADEVITMLSIEPSGGNVNLAQRPGARHSILHGAPGHAIEASLSRDEHYAVFGGRPRTEAALKAMRDGFSLSQDEVISGITSVAVPLRIQGEPAAALAVVTIGVPNKLQDIASDLQSAAARMILSN
ncbi:MAG: helix-turn-helix domain-containing protein [Leucobacter sp.]|nr:helix-turn-helix domain-containing protein [Leucobacter sp.]